MSIRPTHIALLQIPAVQVEPVWPAGVQKEIRTADAESSAGRTTREDDQNWSTLTESDICTDVTKRWWSVKFAARSLNLLVLLTCTNKAIPLQNPILERRNGQQERIDHREWGIQRPFHRGRPVSRFWAFEHIDALVPYHNRVKQRCHDAVSNQ